MTTEVEQVQEKEASAEEAKAAQAAFSASFNDEAPKAPPEKEVPAEPAKADAEPANDEKTQKDLEAATAKADTPIPTPAPSIDMQAELRKLHGRIGDLNSQLQTALKAKEAEGKPAALSPVELKRMKAEFPEMAPFLQEDLAEAIAGLKQVTPDSKVIDTLVSDRVRREIGDIKTAAVTDAHESWKTDLWVDGKLGEKRTHEYEAWLKTMSPEEGQAFEGNSNPYQVIKKLNQFYDWKSKEAKAKTEKQERLKAAITPNGVPRAGQSTLSDEEAMRKGFAEGFSS